MKKIPVNIFAILTLFLFAFCGGAPRQNAATPQKSVVIIIAPGSGSGVIAQKLQDYGLITSRREFRWRVKLTSKEHLLKAGEYEFPFDASQGEIIRMLVEGRVVRHRATIPEGLTYREIAKILGQGGFGDEKKIVALCENRAFLDHLKIPHPTAEGFLFPSTYFFIRTQTEGEILEEMIANHRKAFTADLRELGAQRKLSDYQILILASMIEKETGKTSERPIISSVFHNRLKRKMKLQSDPTTIYGIRHFNGNLTKKDLQTPSPYNTYVIPGLPKGPICNVGREALEAAVRPAETAFLYFVSRNDGTHIFTTNFKDHDRAVTQYQKHLLDHSSEAKRKKPRQGK